MKGSAVASSRSWSLPRICNACSAVVPAGTATKSMVECEQSWDELRKSRHCPATRNKFHAMRLLAITSYPRIAHITYHIAHT